MKKQTLMMSTGKAGQRLGFLLVALVILCSPLTAAAQADFPSLEDFFKATLKGEDRVRMEVTGDLNGDKQDDWVGVIQRQKSDSAETHQLYVLLSSGRNGFRLAAKSKESQIAGMGCCWLENLELRQSSIYIQNNAKTASTMEAATHQFKLYKGEWRLVGLKIYYTDQDADTSTETDMNLLTGAVVEKRQKGDGRPSTKRSRKRFPTSFLRDYDFSNGFGAE